MKKFQTNLRGLRNFWEGSGKYEKFRPSMTNFREVWEVSDKFQSSHFVKLLWNLSETSHNSLKFVKFVWNFPYLSETFQICETSLKLLILRENLWFACLKLLQTCLKLLEYNFWNKKFKFFAVLEKFSHFKLVWRSFREIWEVSE